MLIRRRLAVQTGIVFLVCTVLIIICNVYFLHIHSKSQKNGDDGNNRHPLVSTTVDTQRGSASWITKRLGDQIKKRWDRMRWFEDLEREPQFLNEAKGDVIDTMTLEDAWGLAQSWGSARYVYPKNDQELMTVLRAMVTAPIISATVGSGGTQLKATLTLKGGQKAVFKPLRYPRDAIFTDTPYAGADRHNGEIVAFHLSRLLDFRWSPLVTGRKLNLNTEILPVAERSLKNTFLTKGNNTCFYGVCYYCNHNDPACASGDVMEGALILWLPKKFKLKMHRHPWRRLYKKGHLAPWEENDGHCLRVQKHKLYSKGPRLLDLIDVAVFDFLIGNADRHLYEVLDGVDGSMVILMDNGKSFGNPYDDEVTILAPLYQCCRIRKSTQEKLQRYSGRSLSKNLQHLTRFDALYPLLSEEHLLALDRRRLKVLDVIKYCLQGRNHNEVLLND